MDVNHEMYRTDLIKIAFMLSFMNSGPAATWKYQFVDEKMKLLPIRKKGFGHRETQVALGCSRDSKDIKDQKSPGLPQN